MDRQDGLAELRNALGHEPDNLDKLLWVAALDLPEALEKFSAEELEKEKIRRKKSVGLIKN